MHVIGSLWCQASTAHRSTGICAPVLCASFNSCRLNRRETAARHRLTCHRQLGARQIDLRCNRRTTELHGRTDETPEMRSLPSRQTIRHPASNWQRLLRRDRLQLRQLEAGQMPSPRERSHAPAIAGMQVRHGRIDLGKPGRHRTATKGIPEQWTDSGRAPHGVAPAAASTGCERQISIRRPIPQGAQIQRYRQRPSSATAGRRP